MEPTKQRMLAWWQETVQNIKRGRWWLVLSPPLLWLLCGAIEHRFFGWLNTIFDSKTGKFAAGLLTLGGSFTIPVIVFIGLLLFFIVRAFFTSKPGIVGNADLMVQELKISDLEIVDQGAAYAINLAAFVRMEVASLDRTRTVTRFEIEMTAPDKTLYQAKSEYEVGNYQHKYDVKKINEWGGSTIQSMRERMEDLAAKLRIPIQPYTHVGRAWVRFEIPKVRQGHEPKNCHIRLFAIDPSGKRHEIRTDDMQVKGIADDHEYAALMKD